MDRDKELLKYKQAYEILLNACKNEVSNYHLRNKRKEYGYGRHPQRCVGVWLKNQIKEAKKIVKNG